METMLSSIQPSAPTSFSSLCKIYDTLLETLWKDQDQVVCLIAKNEMDHDKKDDTITIIHRQVENLNALQLVCRFLIGILDLQPPPSSSKQTSTPPQPVLPAIHDGKSTPTKNSDRPPKQRLLEQTLKRSQLLLEVLQQRRQQGGVNFITTIRSQSDYAAAKTLDRSNEEIKVMAFPNRKGLYTFEFVKKNNNNDSSDDDSDDEDDNNNILTFDRKALEEEEQALLQMANTPIPGEEEDGIMNPAAQQQKAQAQAEESMNTNNTAQQQEVNLQTTLETEWSHNVYKECQERQQQKRQRVT